MDNLLFAVLLDLGLIGIALLCLAENCYLSFLPTRCSFRLD
ncbi:hypothetical protein [Bradyrhizobium sp. USDA 4454]